MLTSSQCRWLSNQISADPTDMAADAALGRVVVLASVASALVNLIVRLWSVPDLSAALTPPWWLSLVGTAAAVVGVSLTGAAIRWAVPLLGVGAALMLFCALPRLPHDLLIAITSMIALATGGQAVFGGDVPWLPLSAHLLTSVAAAAATGLATRSRRRARGRCVRCGAVPGRPWRGSIRSLRIAAVAAVLVSLPYAALKAAWGWGWRGGVNDPVLFADVRFFTPGFGDTVLLTGIGMALVTVMAAPITGRVARPLLLLGGAIGSVMLLPVGVLGTAQLLLSVPAWESVDDGGLAAWVFVLVYPSFLTWGVALAATTYWYATISRPPCQHRTPLPHRDRRRFG